MNILKPALVALAALFSGAALAADAPQVSVIGFSPDGRTFAFEQFGVQDGSGFPYAEIFVIDLETDAWVEGSPIRVRIDNETAKLADARNEAKAKATALLDARQVTETGEVLARNPPTEAVPDRRKMAFDLFYRSAWPQVEASDQRYELKLEEVPVQAPAECTGEEGTPFVGLKLDILQTLGGATRELHKDETLPASRGCAVAYDIDSVVAGPYSSAQRFVALIGVYTRGFEGLDRRVIAIPLKLP